MLPIKDAKPRLLLVTFKLFVEPSILAIVPVYRINGFLPMAFDVSDESTVGLRSLIPLGFARIVLGSFFRILPSTEEGPLAFTFFLLANNGVVLYNSPSITCNCFKAKYRMPK